MKRAAQPWIFSSAFDGWFILAPAFIVTGAVILLRHQLDGLDGVPPYFWLLLIVGVDVSHVYSTLFRTYLDKEELQARRMLYTLTPLLAWIIGCLLYSIDGLLFWRVLAYLAVFHFVRQQYGFMMLYGRQERGVPAWCKRLDKTAIYLATLYPLIYWHTHAREFHWFIEDDFLTLDAPLLSVIAGILYLVTLGAYLVKEAMLWKRYRSFNWPRNLLLLGTAISWWVGIVVFDNDLAFTATNVIAHGVPYTALIWIYGRNQRVREATPSALSRLFTLRAIPVYLGALALLAFLEEVLWDGLIWQEHGGIFGFSTLFSAITSATALAWLVPLLALPQATHYVLDAFIWRMNTEGTNWKTILFHHRAKAI